MSTTLGRWMGDRFITYQGEYNGNDWLLTDLPDDGSGAWIITTDHVHASEMIDNTALAHLLAASPTLFHAARYALDAILNSRPDSVPLTDKETVAVRWLRSAIRYADTGEWTDPEPPFKTAVRGDAPMLTFKNKEG